MSMQDYHAHPAIGSSAAKLALKSMQLLRDHLDGLLTKDAAPFAIGRLAHLMVLEPDRFAELTTDKGPINERTGQPYGRDTKAFAQWQADNPHITVVEPWLYVMLQRMPIEVFDALKGSVAESSHFATIAGVDFKCRPDALKDRLILDLKTCVDIDRIDRDIQRREYWFTSAFYRRVMEAATGQRHRHKFIFVEKSYPFRWRIVSLDISYIHHGDDQVDYAINKISAAQKSGDWSDHAAIEVESSMPRWMDDESEGSDDDDAL